MTDQDFMTGFPASLWAAPTNVRSWESNGLNADVAFGPFMPNFFYARREDKRFDTTKTHLRHGLD
jgi:hypothetical protein